MVKYFVTFLLILLFSIQLINSSENFKKDSLNLNCINIFYKLSDNSHDLYVKPPYKNFVLHWTLYLIGSILPIPNLLFFPYYAAPIEWLLTAYGFGLPAGVTYTVLSFLTTCAAISCISAGGYKYFIDQNNEINKNLFSGFIACTSIAYCLNLIFGIIGCAVTGGNLMYYIQENKKKQKKINYFFDINNTNNTFIGLKIYL